jgi:hypothetical protein
MASAQITVGNSCPSITVNLEVDLSSDAPPYGTTLTFHSGSLATDANKLSDVTAVSAGTYYSSFFDSNAGCYSPTSEIIVATTPCVNNNCPSSTVNLETAVSSDALPSGTTLTFHSSDPATDANKLSDVTAVGAGTYYSSFFDSNPGCYSPTSEIVVTIDYCNGTIAIEDYNDTSYDTPVFGNVSINDMDVEGDNQSFALDGANGGMSAAEGTVTLNPNGVYQFTPAAGFSGETTFSYVACDDNISQACDTAMVYIEVIPSAIPAGQPMVLNPDANVIAEGQTTNSNVLANDFDPDGGTLSVSTPLTNMVVAGIDSELNNVANAGTLTLNADGTYTFVPAPGFMGTVTISYTVCNDETPQDCDDADLVIIVIANTGNMTFAGNDAAITDMGVVVSGDVSSNDTDGEGDDQSVSSYLYDSNGDGNHDAAGTVGSATTIGGTDENGAFVANAGMLTLATDGIFTFAPANGFTGNANITYTACDDNAMQACDNATLAIIVLDANRDYGDAPTLYGNAWHRAITDTDGNFILDGSTNVWLGDNTDFESSELSGPSANGDDYDDAMSFGAGAGQFPLAVAPSQNFDVTVRLNGEQVGNEVFYGMWIDWDDDGTYDDFYNGSGIVASPVDITVNITAPATISGTGNVNVRLRSDDNAFSSSDFTGGRTNGEVEDYQRLIPLPVELISFTGLPKECDIHLSWSTASEVNNDHFVMEYSADGQGFSPLGYVEGNGTTVDVQDYQFIHKNVRNPYSYYRIKQVDYDGSFEYSDVIMVKSECTSIVESIVIYPNPTRDIANLEILSSKKTVIDLILVDVAGKLLYQNEIQLNEGATKHVINMEKYAPGTYFISIKNGDSMETFEIVKMK